LGLESFGIYTLAFTTVLLLSVPVSLGLPYLITRYVSKYEVENNQQAIKGLLIRANQLVILITLLVYVIAYISYFFWWKNYDAELVEAIIYSFLLLPLLALGALRAAALRGLKFVILGQLPDTFLRNLFFLIFILIFQLIDIAMTPALAMKLHSIAALIAFIIGAIFLYKKLGIKIKNLKAIYFNKTWLKQALPFSLNSGVHIIKSKLSTYILAIFGSLESVAIFDVATRGASLVAFTLDALNTAIAPYISTEFEKNNLKSLQNIVTKTSRIIFVFSLPVVIAFIFGGDYIINFLFGNEYQNAYLPLVILCLGQLINAATGSVGLVLSMTGRQSYYTKIVVYMTILNTILCIPAVMWLDVLGASILTALLIVVQNLILVNFVLKKININTTILN
jgi:O-antigen/teichoic acid export membrane protein